jgi:hypothetical protein
VCELLFAFLVFWFCQALWSYIFWFLSSIPFSSLWNIQHWHHLNKFLFINIRMATISNVMIQCPSFCPKEEKKRVNFLHKLNSNSRGV